MYNNPSFILYICIIEYVRNSISEAMSWGYELIEYTWIFTGIVGILFSLLIVSYFKFIYSNDSKKYFSSMDISNL